MLLEVGFIPSGLLESFREPITLEAAGKSSIDFSRYRSGL